MGFAPLDDVPLPEPELGDLKKDVILLHAIRARSQESCNALDERVLLWLFGVFGREIRSFAFKRHVCLGDGKDKHAMM